MGLHSSSRTLSLVLCAAIAAVGCASDKRVELSVDPGLVKLSESAESIAQSYKVLAYAESASTSANGAAAPDQRFEPTDFPEAWREEYSLAESYYGELEPFLRGLSRLAGYDEPQIIGKRPVNPVIISVNQSKRTLADFLIDASYQSRGRVNITLTEDSNRLLISY